MQLVMQARVQRRIGCTAAGIDARRELEQLGALGRGRRARRTAWPPASSSASRTMKWPLTSSREGMRIARPGARPALEQSFEFEAQQRLGDRQKAHAELGGELPPRDRLARCTSSPRRIRRLTTLYASAARLGVASESVICASYVALLRGRLIACRKPALGRLAGAPSRSRAARPDTDRSPRGIRC